jgi:hypothetical protein
VLIYLKEFNALLVSDHGFSSEKDEIPGCSRG